LRDQNHAGGFIITEKDAINLGPLLPELGHVAVARVVMELDPANALDTILRLIAERRP
jgi:tetraacyldisaccharide-1-P 4'-kinase